MPEEQWSEAERWAWQQIRAGRVADFKTHHGNDLDPKVPDGWNDGRKLRSDFLKEILFREPYRSAIPVEGVRIVGAWFSESMDLAYGRLNHQLSLGKCRFEGAAELTGLRIGGRLSLEGSAFATGRGLSLSLNSAEIDGSINMIGAAVTGTLNMNSVQVQHLFMRGPNASFQDVNLGSAKVGGQVEMTGAAVAGTLHMNGLEAGHLLMRGPDAAFQGVDLTSARVGGYDRRDRRWNAEHERARGRPGLAHARAECQLPRRRPSER